MTDMGAPSKALRSNALGVSAITFMVVSAAAPLTGAAGGIPLSMLLGNGAGIPGTFLLVTAILLIFAAGYVAMARHVKNAGAFYAFAAQGLGGHSGGAAAMIAMLSYNAMQIGLMGLFGAAASGTFGPTGLGLIDVPWYYWSYAAIAIIAVLGYRQVDLSAKVLMVLVFLEFAIVLLLDAVILGKGGASGLTLAPFTPAQIFSTDTWSIGVLYSFAGFIGFEATTIYSEEARDPHVTVPKATFLSVLAIGIFYSVTSWLMVMGIGMDQLMPTLGGMDPTTFLFMLGSQYLGDTASMIMGVLFVTSVFAALLAFHNAIARYIFVTGREGILPDAVGITHGTHLSPHVGSVIQTILAVLVVTLFVVQGMDPVLQLFSWLSQLGTLGVLGLMSLTSFAVIAFFARNAMGEGAMSTKVLPLIAGVIMAILFVKIFMDFGALTGAEGHLSWILPSLVLVAGAVGIVLAAMLKGRDPRRFADLGKGKV